MQSLDLFTKLWEKETIDICSIQTYRNPDLSNEDVNGRIIQIREYLYKRAEEFNTHLSRTKFSTFQWSANIKEGVTDPDGPEDLISTTDPTDDQCRKSDFWVFGFRFGSSQAKQKICIICHLDTVPANESDPWKPFEPRVEERSYPEGFDSPQPFLVGRGCVDDKGPAISAFIVARELAKKYDGSPQLNDTQVEILFDTSEETAMATPHYLEDPSTEIPDFGIVYDAMWCVRAEKGCERPVFTVDGSQTSQGPLTIKSLLTAPGNSTNTIPDWAEAVISGEPALLAQFASSVSATYDAFAFDDMDYYRAVLTVSTTESGGQITSVTLHTDVEGAQHGSAPEENRCNGANPLVSLANFLAGQVRDGVMGKNAEASLAEFITWTWGTRVFGEAHEDLYKYDSVFVEGNGTTYAVTKVHRDKFDTLTLEIDIRYALDHHETAWDGCTEGLLEGKNSVFAACFRKLVHQFNREHARYADISVATTTIFGPDVRVPDLNADFEKVEQAYNEVCGVSPPRYAIGGGTDAKGYTFLLAVGPLMATQMGPPINYHGLNEGAPISDMGVSTSILYNAMAKQIESTGRRHRSKAAKAVQRVRELRKQGYRQCCSC